MNTRSSRRAFLASGLVVPLYADQRAASPALRFRILGKTGLKVTELGFGSEAVSDTSVFLRAIDAGINFFDTARPYEGGSSERQLGAAIKGKRQKLIISSRSYSKDKRVFAADIDTSMKEIGVDYLDIFYLGQRDSAKEITPEMLDILRGAQKAGKVRFIGLSTHRLPVTLDAIIASGVDVVQTPYSFATGTTRNPFPYKDDAASIESALDRLKKAGIGVVAMKVMAGGYNFGNMPNPNADIHARQGAHQSAIRWALRNDRIQTTSVRMTDIDQLEDDLRAMSRPFNETDAAVLRAYSEQYRPLLCRMCGGCDGRCPKGVQVSDAVRSVMYAESYGAYEKGRQTWIRAAGTVRCSDCQSCAARCLNGVNVHERLLTAESLFA